MIIYKLTNKLNKQIYVGLTKKALSKRIAAHIGNPNSYLGKALRKYGLDSFEVRVIDYADTYEVLQEKERYWIAKLNCKHPNGYNMTDGGDGLINPTQEVRDRIAKKVKALGDNPDFTFEGRKHSEESKRRISVSFKNTFASMPEEERQVKFCGQKGKHQSEEHKAKIGKANKGKLKGRVPWNKGLKNAQVPWNKDHNHPAYQSYVEKVAETNKQRVQAKQICEQIHADHTTVNS